MLCVEETRKAGGLGVEVLPSANRYEPLDASHGAQIMAREVGAVFLIFLCTMNSASL